MNSRLLAVIATALVMSGRVDAQVPVPTQPPATPVLADSIPAFERPNGALLRAGTSTYQLSLTKADGVVVPLGVQVVSVSDASLGGQPGWLIADSRVGTMVATSDSVYVSRGDLSPERWTAVNGRSQLGAAFARDTAFGGVQGYQGRASFALGVPKNVLLSAGMTLRVLEMLPLREGYRSSAMLFVVEGLTPALVPAEIVVEGTARVNAGGRDIDAWRVAIRSGAVERRYWVSRDGARVVRVEQALADGLFAGVLQ